MFPLHYVHEKREGGNYEQCTLPTVCKGISFGGSIAPNTNAKILFFHLKQY